LSLAAEAPLLPVFTQREGFEGFRVEISAPLVAAHGGRRREAVADLLADARDALASRIRRSPLAYRDWLELVRSMESP
jgi:hypothetical protein